MTMKKILYFALAALFALSSCELERTPHSGYTPDDLYEDPEAAFELMLTGVYGQMKGMVDAHHRTGEYPGDNIAKHLSTTDAMSVFIT